MTGTQIVKESTKFAEINTSISEEDELQKLKEMRKAVADRLKLPQLNELKPTYWTPEQQADADSRAVYVANVDYSATEEEVEKLFAACGKVARVTILRNKLTGNPKGGAYVSFADKEGMEKALAKSGSEFRGRIIKVDPKRTNKPGVLPAYPGKLSSRGAFRGRGAAGGRGGRGRGGARGGHGVVVVEYVYTTGYRGRGRTSGYNAYSRGRSTYHAPY